MVAISRVESIAKIHAETPKRRISFSSFIEKVFPATRNTSIPKITVALINSLQDHCEPDPQGNFAYVRGGSMRIFGSNTRDVQNSLDLAMQRVPGELIGSDSVAHQVMTHGFAHPRDLDVALRRKVHSDDSDIQTRIQSVLQSYREDERLRIEVNHLMVGKNRTISLFKVDFYDKETGRCLFKLDINDFPMTAEQKRDSSRIYEMASAVDLLSMGGLSINGKTNDIELSYGRIEGMTLADLYFHHHYLNPATPMIGLNLSVVQALTEGFREVNFRSFDITPLWIGYPDLTLKDLGHIYQPPCSTEQFDEASLRWMTSQADELKQRSIAIMSDIAFGFIANPIISLPLSFINRSLLLTPLGRLIHDWQTLQEIVADVAQRLGSNIDSSLHILALTYISKVHSGVHPELLGPLLIIDALKERHLIPEETPRTLSSFIKLIQPIPELF